MIPAPSRSFLVVGLATTLTSLLLVGCAQKAPARTTPSPPAPAPTAAPATPQPAPAPAPVPSTSPTPTGRPPTPRPPAPPPLTGQVTRASLENYAGWEQLRAQDYTPDAAALAGLKEQMKNVEALLFVASWCPDSKRDVPRLFKIMDQIGFPQSRVTMHALDRTKKDAGGLTVTWKVERVPTFIFVRDGREVGRYIERPTTTLENDILQSLMTGAAK